MTVEESTKRFVLDFLADGRRRTTAEVEAASRTAKLACPDSASRYLSRMRLLGLIDGELSVKDKTWTWWRKPG